jgi:hypothetical protein|tara:strand:- start:91 stop:2100 length:2010 start_codon:yes stop_codon:yes gene_type:complete
MDKKQVTQKIIILFIFGMFLFGCSSDDVDNTFPDSIGAKNIKGNLQKGPFLNGTSIDLYELSTSLQQTGKVFRLEINNNEGYFELDSIQLASNYIELSADGYYFNEVSGYISKGQLNLFALSDVTNKSTVNVNILTHLEKKRIEYLISQGNSFSQAKNSAQTEILEIFGIESLEINESESLNISVSGEGNAILLAASVILQGNRTVGQLTELLANMSNDIQNDGVLDNKDLIKSLHNSSVALNPQSIRSNLVKRYDELGMEINIPDFEKYVLNFIDFTQEPLPIIETTEITGVSETSAIGGGNVINDNGYQITSRGLCWSESPNPTIDNDFSLEGTGIGSFTSDLNNLTAGNSYYVRAYATSSVGTSYGDEIYFPTIDFKTSKIWSNYNTEYIYIIDTRNNLFKSSDNAEIWKYVSNLGFNNKFQLEISGNIMYAGNNDNIYKSIDEGINWESIERIEGSDTYRAFTIDKNSNDIYVATSYALFRFNGENWNMIKTTGGDNSSQCLAVDYDGYVYYGVYLFTIHKSTNKGVSWTSVDYQGWSTTGAMYVTEDNILLMNRWWDGIYWLSGNDCLPLNNGFIDGSHVGTNNVVAKGENYFTTVRTLSGIIGVYKSTDKGANWVNYNNNLTEYDFLKFNNIVINSLGKVFISISDRGLYVLNESSKQWDLLQ